jgi:sugar phosphate isomerase/epimerase
MSSRRNFLRSSAFTIAASRLPFQKSAFAPGWNAFDPSDSLQMGIAGYTFHNISLEDSIGMMKQVNMHAMSIKDFHLPLNSDQAKIDEVLGKFKAADIQIYAAGVIYMKSNAEVDQAFDYARRIGVPMIVGSPNRELLPYVEQRVKKDNIKLAIHNHGPEDKMYPGPKDVYDAIKGMDNRIGLCFDIGHGIRAGADPAKATKDFSSRLLDMHIKDLAANTSSDQAIEMGRGIIDFPSLVRALKEIKYSGRCSIEYEQRVKDPLPGIAESVGYFRGVMKTLG